MTWPDDVGRWMLTREDIKHLRSLYNEQWTPDEPSEIRFPSGVTVPRESFDKFLRFHTVKGKR